MLLAANPQTQTRTPTLGLLSTATKPPIHVPTATEFVNSPAMAKMTTQKRTVLNFKAALIWRELIMALRRAVMARHDNIIDDVVVKIDPIDTKLCAVGNHTAWKQEIIHRINDAGLLGHLEGTAVRPERPADAIAHFDKKQQAVREYIMRSITNSAIQECIFQGFVDGEVTLDTPADIMYAVATKTRAHRMAVMESLDKFLACDGSEFDNLGALTSGLHRAWLDLKIDHPALSDDIYIAVMLRVTKNAYPHAYEALDTELYMGNLTVKAMRDILLDEADRGIIGETAVMVRN